MVRDVSTAREPDTTPAKRSRARGTTKQMHERLLRALGDRRVKRAFD
jgi:hypothetical protein